MSRARVLLLAPVLAAGILLAGAGPASAATQSPNANCIGASASFYNLFGKVVFGAGGFGGYLVSGAAHAGNPAYVCF